MPKKNKRVSFDKAVGGAIQENVKKVEAEPVHVDAWHDTMPSAIRDLYRDLAHKQDYDIPQLQSLISNLEQTPKNLDPFFAFQYLYEYERETSLLKNLKRELSGKGGRQDPHHVQRIVHNSLQKHPELLSVYVKGKV